MRYALIVRINDERWQGRQMRCPNDAAAIEAARTVLQATIDFRPLTAGAVSRATIGIGRGESDRLSELTWLGEWDWSEMEEDWRWLPSPMNPD